MPEPLSVESDGLPSPRRQFAMIGIMTAIAMAVIDGAVVNVALPTIARTLGVAPDKAIWIVTAYQIALVISLFTFASLGEIYGCRRVFVAGLLLSVIASLACVSANSLPALLAARTAQGFASAAIVSVSTALMRFTRPRSVIGRTVGHVALLVAVSTAAAPPLGSAIIAATDWRWIFLPNVMLAALSLCFVRALPDLPRKQRRFNWLSAVLSALVLGLMITGLGNLAQSPVLGLSAIGIALVMGIVLMRRELREADPLVPVDLVRIRAFTVAIGASACIFAAQSCAFVGLPFFLQHDLALGEVEMGFYLTVWPIAVACTAPLAGRFADRLPASLLCTAGAVALTAGLALLAALPAGSPGPLLVAATALAGIGFGSFQTPNNRAILLSAPLHRSGAAGGMQATARQFGQAIGAALVSLAFSASHNESRLALLIGAVLAAMSAVISFLRTQR